ncbi:MAG: succinate dehydrogenase cytochrome b subunit [Desulfobacteraceae bacterium]|nr:succinate dehydrogenase cytochrome b subunit [Desulfobacteraceae bacterium]MBC2757052.1 succinate dehydrogenase cytochrome b subunit [Desulfobacteraceae bacterium]
MNWFFNMLRSSIGKKLLMALTGLGFCLFLLIHLIGNLTLYGGKGLFLSYVEHLHALGPLIRIAELGLLAFAAIHVSSGLILFWQNLQARPVRYQVSKNAGGRTIGSATMPYTGVLILIFVVIHLLNFHFIDHSRQTVFQAIDATFSMLPYVIFYTFAVIIVAIHISHGFWSLFQTFGANHPKYMPAIKGMGVIFSLLAAAGFGFIPVYVSFIM